MMIRRALNAALRRTSTVLIGFGLVLVLIGVGVQAARALRIQRIAEQVTAPSFESSVRDADQAAAGDAGVAPVGEQPVTGDALGASIAALEPYPGMDSAGESGTDLGSDSDAGVDGTVEPSPGLGSYSDDVAPFFIPWSDPPFIRYIPISVVRKPRYRFATPTSVDGADAKPAATNPGGGTPVSTTPGGLTEGSDVNAVQPSGMAAMPERIMIPSLKLDRRVVEIGWDIEMVDNETLTSVWQTARHAAGFHRGSAPVGSLGNTVISGHNNIDGAVFGQLHLLEPGAMVMLEADGEIRTYEVEMNFIVQEEGVPFTQRQENARWIGKTPDERLTLVTCYPPWGNSHRTIVVARPVADQSGTIGKDGAR